MSFFQNKRGLTLFEAMVAIALLAVVSAGIVTGSIQIRKMAESSVRENTASSVAAGFLEQMVAIDYPVLEGFIGAQVEFDFAIRDGGTQTVTINNPNNPPVLRIPIGDDDGDEINMDFWFIPRVAATPDGYRSILITIDYFWNDPWSRDRLQRSMAMVRAASNTN